MRLTIGTREVLLPEGEHLLAWLDKAQQDRETAERIENLINARPVDHEEARRIAWLQERLTAHVEPDWETVP